VSLPIAVLVSGEGTNLQAILDTLHGGDVEVVGVAASGAEARGLERAREAGIETAVFAKADYADREARDRALADWIEARGARLVVLAGFMELLGPEFIGRFRNAIVNVHPALLPAFAGVHAIEQALDYGVKVAGVTVHFVDEGVDSGPIILQRSFELPYPRDIAAVEQKVHEIEHELLPQALSLIARGKVNIDPADPRWVIVDE
jgi:phosphoribosylglycinamide formyltransferase-1